MEKPDFKLLTVLVENKRLSWPKPSVLNCFLNMYCVGIYFEVVEAAIQLHYSSRNTVCEVTNF